MAVGGLVSTGKLKWRLEPAQVATISKALGGQLTDTQAKEISRAARLAIGTERLLANRPIVPKVASELRRVRVTAENFVEAAREFSTAVEAVNALGSPQAPHIFEARVLLNGAFLSNAERSTLEDLLDSAQGLATAAKDQESKLSRATRSGRPPLYASHRILLRTTAMIWEEHGGNVTANDKERDTPFVKFARVVFGEFPELPVGPAHFRGMVLSGVQAMRRNENK